MDSILSKLTFAGAIYLALVSIVPLVITNSMPGLNFYYGGTSLLIVVGVALDTVAQLESYRSCADMTDSWNRDGSAAAASPRLEGDRNESTHSAGTSRLRQGHPGQTPGGKKVFDSPVHG